MRVEHAIDHNFIAQQFDLLQESLIEIFREDEKSTRKVLKEFHKFRTDVIDIMLEMHAKERQQ